MVKRPGIVLSLVERGWSAARKCSLELQCEGIGMLHLVKGRLSPEVRAMVQPKPGIALLGLPYSLFWPAAWMLCVWLAARGRLRAVLVDNERSQRRVGCWLGWSAGTVVMVQDTEAGWGVSRDGKPIARDAWRTMLYLNAESPNTKHQDPNKHQSPIYQ